MFGLTDHIQISIFQLFILIICSVAVCTDLLWGKIYNWLTFPAIFSALGYFIYSSGITGLSQVCIGTLFGFILFGWMYALRVLGAGDVKLLMAIGAWGGWKYAGEVAFLSIVLGGLIALLLLVAKGNFFHFLIKMYYFFLSITLNDLEFLPPKIDKTLRMPFALPIGLAAIWIMFGHPLAWLGIRLWS